MSDAPVTLTPEQEAYVDLVRNAMITGFLTLSEKVDEVRRESAACGPRESAHDVLSRVLADMPRSFIAFRPFEIIEITNKLKDLADAEDRLVD